MDEKGNETKYLGRKKDEREIVSSDIYEITSPRGTRIIEVKSITELMRHYDRREK